MRKKSLNSILILTAVFFVILGSRSASSANAEIPQCKVRSLEISTRQGKVSVSVEVAVTVESRQAGLMNRTDLDHDAGMLFIYPPNRAIALWMKNTLIPLDMLFIDNGGIIRFIKHDAQPHDLTPVPEPTGIVARAALELNGGRTKELGIKIGDQVQPVWLETGSGCKGA